MNIKYKLILFAIAISSISFISCKDDKEDIIPVEIPELELGKSTIEISVDSTAIVNITQGAGEYQVFSLNSDIAKAELSDNKIYIKGVTNGTTSILVSDKNNEFRQIKIVSHYNAIKLANNSVNISMKLGNDAQISLRILGGNGSYIAKSDTNIVDTSISGDSIIQIVAHKKGVANIKVSDSYGLSTNVTVNVETTTIPYSEDELNSIKSDATSRFSFYGYSIPSSTSSSFKLVNTVENGKNLYGWTYYSSYYYMKFYFSGDNNLGIKSDATFSYKYSVSFTDEPLNLEIIKNDGTKIWATFSFVKNEKLYYGYFCTNKNSQ
nr:pilus assembly protein N-terminal domain-containing protein [uncultured Bacteroides sp.]